VSRTAGLLAPTARANGVCAGRPYGPEKFQRIELTDLFNLFPVSVGFGLLRTAAQRDFRETAGFATTLNKLSGIPT
jgi:hypothetical protein